MTAREQEVNDALRVLDEMHRLCCVERDDYRQRRRRLLESLSDAAACAGRDMVRHTVTDRDTQGYTQTHSTARARFAADRIEASVKAVAARERGTDVRRAAVCAFVFAALACAAVVVCWFVTGD